MTGDECQAKSWNDFEKLIMSLASGTRLGVYEILSPLGAGGMGEVDRARDTKLQRDVALKILPETMACDARQVVIKGKLTAKGREC